MTKIKATTDTRVLKLITREKDHFFRKLYLEFEHRFMKGQNSDKPEYKNSQVFQLHGREWSGLELRYRIRAQVQTF